MAAELSCLGVSDVNHLSVLVGGDVNEVTVLWMQYSMVQYSTVQYSTVQYSTVQYSTVQYSTVQWIRLTLASNIKISIQYNVL